MKRLTISIVLVTSRCSEKGPVLLVQWGLDPRQQQIEPTIGRLAHSFSYILAWEDPWLIVFPEPEEVLKQTGLPMLRNVFFFF